MTEEELLETIVAAYIEENNLDSLDDDDYDNIIEVYDEFVSDSLDESSRKSHGNMDNGSPRGQGLSPSAKRELDRQTKMPKDVNEPEGEKKTWDAFRANLSKKSPARRGDNSKGDTKIVNPVDDISKKAVAKEDDGFKSGHVDVSVKKGNT